MTALHFAANVVILSCMTQSRNQQRLITLCRALYGERWQRKAAAALGKSQNEFHRYATGKQEPSDEIVERLERLAQQRESELRRARSG